MRLNLVEAVCEPANVTNEDLFDHNGQAAWVFDGATGIGPKTILTSPTDPYWLVQTMNAEIKRAWRAEQPTRDILRAAATGAIRRYETELQGHLPDLVDRPTSCLIMARLWKGDLELTTIGDCWAMYRAGGKFGEFGNDLGGPAQPVRDELARLLQTGVPLADTKELLLPFHRCFRSTANQEGGYPIVNLTTDWIDRLDTRTVAIRPGDKFLLMSDGFYRFVDVFRKYDAASLFQQTETRGIRALYNELRADEKADADCRDNARYKIHDDVTAAMLTISP